MSFQQIRGKLPIDVGFLNSLKVFIQIKFQLIFNNPNVPFWLELIGTAAVEFFIVNQN